MEKESLDGNMVFLIHDFMSAEECKRHINLSESKGYDEATITTLGGMVMRKDVRNNDRLMVDDPELAEELYERAKPFLPEEWFGWHPVGFNERFRYYRYAPGQRFHRHSDGYFGRSNGERSQFTFMIYLNEDFEGGKTTFLENADPVTGKPPLVVVPKTGCALVFFHHQLHEGGEVTRGHKYVLRTDIMHARNRG